jgi:hypothetical protein
LHRNGADRRPELFFRLAQQFATRPVDEMKPAAGLAEYGFIGAVRTVRCGFIREPVLHVHAGTGTFEEEAIHPVCQSSDWTVFRIDPCQCWTAQGVQPGAAKAALCESQTSN